ncbi:MAG: hypothetical protein PG981_000076 [Wolbachia endosymbiont of Ctenocephalides orientis wCori]|nr:MAG: hypothetical protein PG981_000017 [Wolbachia endosymbiont of Ctenocephalides orientis wCori]WCR53045.1 MAG: hypothetical protein PG981_000067 [Wolbachia endosymbiont of Ctenocephalides orientis wCori]WCR53054.1 MAG: hypothetical protein PG981_000076 [Wolbachia endosymbiont of Ctenocephalides orientis wCori]
MVSNRKKYTVEFKLEAIKLVKETGQSANKIAKDLGIDNSTLSEWIKKYNEKGSIEEAFPGKGKLEPYDKERFELKKQELLEKETF